MLVTSTNMQIDGIFPAKLQSKILITSEMAYSCRFSKGENLDLDQKSFITLKTDMKYV